jgi:outer membrane protein assembly factor BamB
VATKRLRRHNRRTTALLGLVLSTGLCLGALASATPAAAAPSISFAPTSGAAGTRVLITESGAGFGKVTAVRIAGVLAVFHVASPSQINAIVPAMPAAVGPITVQIGTTRVSSSTMFTVLPGLVLSPATGPPGSAVNVSGTGFGHSETVSVSFDGTVLATPPASTKGSFGPTPVTVPAAATAGSHTISALGNTTGLLAQTAYTVTPTIVVSPGTGPPGSAVNVSGAGFGPLEGVDVYFDTTDLALAETGANGSFGPVSITVPASAVPGTHTVSAEGRQSGVFAQASLSVNTNWAEFHYSAKHKGADPFENVLSPANVSAIDQDWSFTTGSGVSSSPAVVNGVVYVGSDDSNVYALNANGGSKLWSFATGGSVLTSPAVANGLVYVAANGSIDALSAATGAQQWTQGIGSDSESSPTVANGSVYVGMGASVYAYTGGGDLEWTFTTGEVVDAAPTVTNGVVYVGSVDGNIYALNAATGTQIWKFSPAGSEVETSPAVANGVVYVAADNGNIYALNAATGTQIWSFTTGSNVFSSPAVANGVVYVGSNDGNVYALNATTGTQVWSFTTGGAVGSSPAVANGVVYVGSNDGNVYALNAATGTRLWSFATGGAVGSSPAVVNGVVYVGSSDGNLYAFDLTGGQAAPARASRSSLHPNYSLRPQHRQPA